MIYSDYKAGNNGDSESFLLGLISYSTLHFHFRTVVFMCHKQFQTCVLGLNNSYIHIICFHLSEGGATVSSTVTVNVFR